jgi:hypothetical protein
MKKQLEYGFDRLHIAIIMERCSLFLPPRGGAGPMALVLWLDLVI